MAFETLLFAREENFAVITLNRPPANAINEKLVTELNDALCSVENDDGVRSVIITGAGDRIFCGGADLGSAFQGGNVEVFIRFGNAVMRKIERFPKPVIAAVNGHATGGGCEISMACHFRLMKETARIGQTESNLGIIPGYGGTQRLPRLIGRTKALEMLILGSMITAPEALALGLVTRLTKEGETLADAKALARQLGKRPPIATRLLIEAVDDGLEAPIDKAIDIEVRAFLKTLHTEDAAEGIQAFFGKRAADFKGK
ncbi:MAG: enoyl-CoA hydratase/isomerase family protein [Candidatus Rokubacteria bacterium]|nr:enoyl-CoA hydratase/isomerase family protein [Candidatus Rokubacteria bacterium]